MYFFILIGRLDVRRLPEMSLAAFALRPHFFSPYKFHQDK